MPPLAADHSVFINQVIEPLRIAMGGAGPFTWIEDRADELARHRRRRAVVDFDPAYRRALNIRRANYIESKDLASARDGWDASLDKHQEGYEMALVRFDGSEHIRSIEAHEFAHALLLSEEKAWRALHTPALMVNPAIERLADDIARALLLPRSLIAEVFETAGPLRHTIWQQLPSFCRNTITPFRTGASRLAPFLMPHGGAVFCYAIKLQEAQPGLFDTPPRLAGAPPDIGLRWCMRYSWHASDQNPREYMFCDQLGSRRQLQMEGDEAALAQDDDLRPIPESLVRSLVGPKRWNELALFSSFERFATTPYKGSRLFFVLCEP